MNEYDDLINQDKTESLRTSMFAASRTQPDQEAELLKLSERTGVPVEAIRLKKPEVEMMDRINSFDYEKVIKESPKLSAWLADPKNAALASDDWENLSGLEKTFTRVRDIGGSLAGGVVGDVVGRTVSGASTLLDVGARTIDRPIRQAFGNDVANLFWYEAPTIGGVSIDPMASLRATGQNIKAVGDWLKPPKERQNLATDVAGGVGQLGGQIATAILTGGGSAMMMMFAQGADAMSEKIDKDAASQTNKDIAILTGAGITAVTEKIGLDKILNRVPPEIRNRTLRFIADKVAAGGIEAGQEFAEGLLQDIARKTLTNRDAELLGGIEREVTAAGISAAIVRTALGVRGYNRAREQEQFVRALTDQAAGSKLRERMPDKFKAYMDQLTANGPVENVFIPADQFTTYFQSQGLDPAKEASKLGVQNFAEASVAGTDVVIPTSQFVTQLSGTDALQGLWQDIRFQQGEMTLRESQQFRRDEADTEIDDETLARMTGAEPIETSDFATVKAQVVGELQGRFQDDVIDKYATQFAAMITTMAKRNKLDIRDPVLWDRLRVAMPMMDGLKDSLDRVDIDLDPLLDRLRAGDMPDMSQAFGPSLSEFIRQRGGLQDMEETARLDDSRPRGQGRIVRPDGQSLDAALEAAIDAGYFDGRAIEELSQNDLLDALAQDVGGSPVYSSRAQDKAVADQVRVLNDLQGFLDTIGADVSTMTNAEIRAKFREDAADGVGAVYDQPFDGPETATTPLDGITEIEVDGVMRPAVNSAGQPIHWSQEGVRNFWRWFGDSRVVDADGKPLVMYHGTRFDQGIDAFKTPAYFSSDPASADVASGITDLERLTSAEAARGRAMPRRLLNEYYGRGQFGGSYPAFLSVKNPIELNGQSIKNLSDKEIAAFKSQGFDGAFSKDESGGVRGVEWVAFDATQIKSATGNSGAFSGDNPNILYQTATVRAGKETLAKYGLDPNGKYKTREVAAALEARQRAKWGSIAADDRSPQALRKIAGWMAEEVEFEMANPEKSGVGWYSEKFQRALDTMAQAFPELATDKTARNTMTALIAITSDGQKVVPNFAQAMEIYGKFKETGKFTTGRGHVRIASINNNLEIMQRLYDQMGPESLHDYLMQEKTISELKQIAKANGGELKSAYQAHIKMPMAAVEFGPKLGAFYANLMGAHGYLTMDRWWSRTFNRYRGTLLQKPTEQGLTRFKELLGQPELSNDEAIAATVEYRNSYEAKNFKNGTEIEKAANTIWKAAFDELKDAPFNATDRTFMLNAVNKTQQQLAKKGYNLSVADIQAILWYYEKRLYGELGARQTADVSYEEAAQRVVAGYAGGSGDVAVSDDAAAAQQDGGAVEAGIPVGEETFGEVGQEFFQEVQADRPDLIITHNLTAKNLLHAVKIGGIAVPSLAITRAENPLLGFGEITLIGDRNLADPKGKSGIKVFGADIYSPRYPSVIYQFKDADTRALAKKLQPAMDQVSSDRLDFDELSRRGSEELTRTPGVMAAFLNERGIEFEIARRTVKPLPAELQPFENDTRHSFELAEDAAFVEAALAAHENMLRTAIGSEELAAQEIANLQSMDDKSKFRLVRSYASQVSDYRNAKRMEGQVDSYPTRANMQKAIEENGLTEDFGEYAQELFDSLKPTEKLFQGFTNSGDRRYIPHTLDNVVKILKKELRGGENFNYGIGTLRSKFTPQFRSLKDIKTNKDRLVSNEQFEQVKEEIDQELDAIMNTLQPYYAHSDMRTETVMAVMEDAPKMGIASALKSYSFNDVPADAISAIGAFMTKLRELPTEYFEAKILREVSPGEFSGAIVPADVDPKALKALRDNGVTDIRTYQPGNEADRKAQISSFENLYFQRTTDDKRGSIQIGANRKMKISLFEKANLSTFLHETGHFYLEVMGDLAEAPDAPQQIKDDYAAILKWMGVQSRAQIKTPQHEMFARANEAYLREGKAPSPELRGAFQRFRDWLISIYQSAQDLNVTLSDDLRAVFDRMYATDEQIEAAESEAEFTQMFANAADAGMTEAEFKAYSESVRQTIERGKEQLQSKLMRQLQREKEAEWKANREKMRAEVEEEVDAQPVYVAFKALKDGQTADEIPVKLSRDNLVEVFGAPFLKTLPRGFQRIYSAQGGVDIDTAAEMFGFDSGRSLIDALANMKPRDALIEQITDDRMRDLFGDIRFDGTIAEEAMQALHNSERENVLKIELRAIRKKAAEVRPFVQAERNRVREEQAAERQTQAEGEQFVADALPSAERQGRTKAGRTFTYRAFDPEPMKRAAAGLIGQKQVRDIRPQGYLIAERNAARLGAKAMKDGDFMTAAEQKQRELFNHYLYKEASRVLDEVETKAKWLREQGSDAKRKALGKAGADYLEQVDEILERYEFKRVPLNKLAKRESLIAWMEQQELLGNAVVVPEDVINEARRANWKQIPVDELRGVYDAVKNITHLARLKNKLIVRGQQRDFQAMKDELLDAIADSTLKSTDELMQINASERTIRQKGAALWRSFDSAHIKIEQLVEWLDNGDINGPWARNFFDLADAAQTAEYDLHRKVTKALDDVRKAMPKGWQSALFDKMDFDLPLVTGTGTAAYSKPTRYTMLSIALNMGNEQNMQRLQDGNRFTDEQLAKVRDAMTADDWKFVQGVWDAIENLWPDMAALEVRASGVAPEKVEPMSFDVDGVTYRGGYFPLVYDSRVSAIGEKQIEGDKSVEAFMASGFGRPSTNKGATKKRQEQVKQPLLLDMNEVIGGHIAKVVKDISHREAVAGLYKILSDQDIKTALIDRLGEAYYREMRDWTKILVNDRSDSMLAAKGAAKIAMLARTNLTIVSMGWKVTTMMAQFAGFGPSADLVSPGYLARALLQSTQSPQQTWEMISQKSGEMRNRVQTIDRDVRDSMRRIADKRSIVADVQRTAFILTAYADRIVTVPTWLGAYNQAIAEGKGEEAAIRAGDRAVRLSQGGGGAKDLAAVQRNNELMKLMTMFYTPFSALYARLRDVGHQQSVQGIGYLPKAVARLGALVILPAVLGELLAGRGPDEDEDEVWWATRRILLYPVASLPGIRDFSGLMEQKMIALSGDGKMEYQPSFQISPVVNAIAKAYRNLVDRPIDVLAGERELDDQIVQGMFESSGLLVGLPTAQVSITGGYLYRLMIGEEQPENIGEVMTGLMFRPEKK